MYCCVRCKEIFILFVLKFSIFVFLIKQVPSAVAVNKRKLTKTTKRLALFLILFSNKHPSMKMGRILR